MKMQPRAGAPRRRHDAWARILAPSVALAVGVHALAFAMWPPMEVSTAFDPAAEAARVIVISAAALPDLATPMASEPIAAPELPAVAPPEMVELDLEIPSDLAELLPSFDDALVMDVPDPPLLSEEASEWADYVHFAPSMVYPEIRNRRQMERFLKEHYQPLLDATGVVGKAQVHFWIDETGRVQKSELAASSGSEQLDRLALELSELLRFSPALRAGEPVRVQVVVPITFREA
jgi:TonB family protein